MLSTYYNRLNFALVQDQVDLYKQRLPEMPKVKSLVDNSKLLFSLPSDRVELFVAEGERVYKINLLMPDINKYLFGWIIYIPDNRQLDIYTSDNPTIPLIQYKGKKVAFKNYSTILDKAGLDKLFEKLYNVL